MCDGMCDGMCDEFAQSGLHEGEDGWLDSSGDG